MQLTLLKKKEEAPGVSSFTFTSKEPMKWKAGQFFHYILNHDSADSRGPDRWFTIASAPSEKSIMLTTRFAVENGSSFKKALQNLNINDAIEAVDLDGDFTVEDLGHEYVFIAGGIGITPMRSILKELDSKKSKISATLLYANRDENIVYKEELEEFSKNNPKLKIHYITSPERINKEVIQKFVSDIKQPLFYVSGPEAMVESLGNTLKEMGVEGTHLKQDWFPGY